MGLSHERHGPGCVPEPPFERPGPSPAPIARKDPDAKYSGLFKSRKIGSSKKRTAKSSRQRSHTLNRGFLGKFREFLSLLAHRLKLLAGVFGGHLNEL
jgi:hypothetical protein